MMPLGEPWGYAANVWSSTFAYVYGCVVSLICSHWQREEVRFCLWHRASARFPLPAAFSRDTPTTASLTAFSSHCRGRSKSVHHLVPPTHHAPGTSSSVAENLGQGNGHSFPSCNQVAPQNGGQLIFQTKAWCPMLWLQCVMSRFLIKIVKKFVWLFICLYILYIYIYIPFFGMIKLCSGSLL